MMRILLFLFIFTVYMYSPVKGQVESKYNTYLSISADNTIESQLYSLLSRELSKFEEVQISDSEDALLEIDVITLKQDIENVEY